MNGAFGNGLFNSTFIETDLDGNLVNNGEMPFWLRDIIERAFANSGIRMNRKVASKDAIASLQDVDPSTLTDSSCPICYDPYVTGENKKKRCSSEMEGDNMEDSSGSEQKPGPRKLHSMAEQSSKHGVNMASPLDARQFKDPSLFLPVDMAANSHIRFPQTNLATLTPVSESEMFPAMTSSRASSVDSSQCEHIPVCIPTCGHVFGKPCIIEWLNRNVSCPLCRKEVEALKESDPLTKKIDTIKRNCNFIFAADKDQAVQHLAGHSTDVFNPTRKPFNPMITPLTDTLVNQEMVTPTYPEHLVPSRLTRSRDPQMVLTRKYPLSHISEESTRRRPPSVLPQLQAMRRFRPPANTSVNSPPTTNNGTTGPHTGASSFTAQDGSGPNNTSARRAGSDE